MKKNNKKNLISPCNLNTIKNNNEIRNKLLNLLADDEEIEQTHFYGTPMSRQIPIRKKFLYPPPEIQKEILYRSPVVSNADLLSILDVIRNTGIIFEKTPSVFSIHSIEELRNIIASNLNITFTSDKAEELFKIRGKTSFYMEAENKDIFLGKCAEWKYPEALTYAIESMLNSVTCPDCKGVLLIFNKSEACLPKVVVQTRGTLMRHPCLHKMDEIVKENELSMTMHSHENKSKRLHIRTIIYDLYSQSHKPCSCLNELEREFFANKD